MSTSAPVRQSSPSASTEKGTTRRLLGPVFHTLGANIIAIPVGLLGTAVVARSLGPDGKGAYDLVLATTTLLVVLLGFSLPSGVTYIVARGRTAVGSLLRRLVPFATLQGAAAVVGLLLLEGTALADALLPASFSRSIIGAVGMLVVILTITSYFRAILMGREEIRRVNQLEVAGKVGSILLLVVVAIVFWTRGQQPTATNFVWATLIGAAVTSALFARPVAQLWRDTARSAGLREAWSFSMPSYAANTIQFLNYRADLFIISMFLGVSGVGLYTLAVGLGQLIWLLSNAVAAVLFPSVASKQQAAEENIAQTVRVTRLALWISGVGGIIAGMGSILFVPLVFGEAFTQSIRPLWLLLPGIVCFSVANVLAAYNAGLGKPQWNLAASALGLGVTIVFDLLLIPTLGIEGAALASSLSYISSTALILWLFMRHTGARLTHVLLPTREDLLLIYTSGRQLLARVAG